MEEEDEKKIFKQKRSFNTFKCYYSLQLQCSSCKCKNDTEASTYGFMVDSDEYYKTSWYNSVETKVKLAGNIIGVCTTNIGFTRAKDKATGGKYLDQILVKNIMKGKHPKSNYAGYAEYLTVQSTLPKGTELAAYSPESEAGMKSYDIGVSVSSDKTAGISASTTVTKSALEIDNNCDTSDRLYKVGYDYKHETFRWDWSTYSKYAYYESIQRSHYTIKTNGSKYTTKLIVKPKFERWSDVPKYWADAYGQYSTVTNTITFTTTR